MESIYSKSIVQYIVKSVAMFSDTVTFWAWSCFNELKDFLQLYKIRGQNKLIFVVGGCWANKLANLRAYLRTRT